MDEVLWFENYDLQNIYTPVDADKFEELLIQTGYDRTKTDFIINGFRRGFLLNFKGNWKVKQRSANLKLEVVSKVELWNKILKEVKAKRVAGPYEEIPFEFYIQSPVGSVPKDKGTKTCLIFHLSHPRSGKGQSVNAGIPAEDCSVKYPDFSEAVELCVRAGRSCAVGKSDIAMAFRHVPLSPECGVS